MAFLRRSADSGAGPGGSDDRIAAPVRIVATGHFLPPRIVPAAEIDARTGMPQGWTARNTGVEIRHHVEDETAAEMGAAALSQAMLQSDWEDSPPDLLIGASGTPQQPIPCTAALIGGELGWGKVPCFDVNATCLSFVVALQIAGALIAGGTHRRIAIVSSEISSKGLNWREPEAAALMGDGAAAVLVESQAGRGSALVRTAMETWPEGSTLTEIRGGGSRLPAVAYRPGENCADFLFHMDGPGVFRLAAQKMEPFVTDLVGGGPHRWDAIDWVIPHQASLPGIRRMARKLGIPPGKLVETVQHHGNVIAASIPLAIHELASSGRLQRGQTLLLLGTSAGFSIGGAVIRY